MGLNRGFGPQMILYVLAAFAFNLFLFVAGDVFIDPPIPLDNNSDSPSMRPSLSPWLSLNPSNEPSRTPSYHPTTGIPSLSPSRGPTTPEPYSTLPTSSPSRRPSTPGPSFSPSTPPTTAKPSSNPNHISSTPTTHLPSRRPSRSPTRIPTTASPSQNPLLSTLQPAVLTNKPSQSPIFRTDSPTSLTRTPTRQPISRSPTPAVVRPNIIIILVDDLGYGEVNAHDPRWAFPVNPLAPGGGQPVKRAKNRRQTTILSTPNLVAFAKQGVRLTMAYAPSSICAPTRAALLLGRHVGKIDLRENTNQELRDYRTFPKEFRAVGYRTGYFGKWGLGALKGGPWNHGFDQFVGHLTNDAAHTAFPDKLYRFDSRVNAIPTTMQDVEGRLSFKLSGNVGRTFNEMSCPRDFASTCQYDNDVFRDEFLKYIQRSSPQPFLAFWAPTYPHAAQYNNEDPHKGYKAAVKRLKRMVWKDEILRGHAAQIESHLNDDIGALLKVLNGNSTLDRNTFVIFTSDNGAHSEPIHRYSNKFFKSTGGLRGGKYTMFEGGLRVPTIIRYRGKISEGTVNRVPFNLYDIPETLRELAKLPSPYAAEVGSAAGISMLRTWLTGNEALAPIRQYLFSQYCTSDTHFGCTSALIDISAWRKGKVWKLITNIGGSTSLFQIVANPTETKPQVNTAMRQSLALLQSRIVVPYRRTS